MLTDSKRITKGAVSKIIKGGSKKEPTYDVTLTVGAKGRPLSKSSAKLKFTVTVSEMSHPELLKEGARLIVTSDSRSGVEKIELGNRAALATLLASQPKHVSGRNLVRIPRPFHG